MNCAHLFLKKMIWWSFISIMERKRQNAKELCRISTLYKCISASEITEAFHKKHRYALKTGKMNSFYNDDCIGINFYVNGNQCYYIGFNGLNCDISKGNIHSSEGRIQLFTGDGHPNKVLDKKNKIIKISYPSTSEDSLIQLLKKEDFLLEKDNVYYTGYKVMGESDDILLTSSKNDIIKFAEFLNEVICQDLKNKN